LGRPDRRRPRPAPPPVVRRPPRTPPGSCTRNNCAAAVFPGSLDLGEGLRRSVSAATSHRAPATRGHLRIYLGCAPGAGTTCALLGEGHRRTEHGTDVVVAGVETRGRPGTEALLAGLEVISPPTVAGRGTAGGGGDLGPHPGPHPQGGPVGRPAPRKPPRRR